MYAVIVTGGKQYKVAEGDVLYIEKLGVDAEEEITFDNVLAVSTDKGFKAVRIVQRQLLQLRFLRTARARKSLYLLTSQRRMKNARWVIVSHIQRLKLQQSTLNYL